MKLHPKQLAAIREKLNAINFWLESAQNVKAAALCEDLAEAISTADRRSDMKKITTTPHDSGAWQEAK